MKNKVLLLLAILLLLLSGYLLFSSLAAAYHLRNTSENERNQCLYKADNSRLRIYNDILIELVETRFSGYYLRKHFKQDSFYKSLSMTSFHPDSVRIKSIHGQKAIFNKPNQWCTLYLDTALTTSDHLDDLASYWGSKEDRRIPVYLEIDPNIGVGAS